MTSADLESLISCPVCMYRYDTGGREPRQFGCTHNVCATCVNGLPPGAATCPLCRYREPTRNPRDLPLNRGMRDLLQAMQFGVVPALPAEQDEPLPEPPTVVQPALPEPPADGSDDQDDFLHSIEMSGAGLMPRRPTRVPEPPSVFVPPSYPVDSSGRPVPQSFVPRSDGNNNVVNNVGGFFNPLASQPEAHVRLCANDPHLAMAALMQPFFRGVWAEPVVERSAQEKRSILQSGQDSFLSSRAATSTRPVATAAATVPATVAFVVPTPVAAASSSSSSSSSSSAAAPHRLISPEDLNPPLVDWNPPLVEELDAPRFYKISLGCDPGLHMSRPCLGPQFMNIHVLCPTGARRARMLIYGTKETMFGPVPLLRTHSPEFDSSNWANPIRPMFVPLTKSIYLHVDSSLKKLLWSDLDEGGRRDVVVYDTGESSEPLNIIGLHGSFNKNGVGSSGVYLEMTRKPIDRNSIDDGAWAELPFDSVQEWLDEKPNRLAFCVAMRFICYPPKKCDLDYIRLETGLPTAVSNLDNSAYPALTFEVTPDGKRRFAIRAKTQHDCYIAGPPCEAGAFEMSFSDYVSFTHTPTEYAYRPLMTLGSMRDPHLWIAFESLAGNLTLVFVKDPSDQ